MKFKLTKTTKEPFWTTLYQIKALKDFWNVSKWDLWWWIEKESNLSQEDNSRVSWDALVYWDALVSWNARVSWDARVYWDARVSWNAVVSWEIKLQSWWCFARKDKNRDIAEIENEWTILLIKDYEPIEDEEAKKMTVKEIIDKLWYEIEIVD